MARKATGGTLTQLENGHYQMRVMFQGKRKKITLRNLDGSYCCTRKDAEAAREREMRVYREQDAAERARMTKEAFSTQEERLQQVREEIQNKTVTIAAGWEIFNRCQHRTKGTKRKQERGVYTNYQTYYKKFMEWMQISYPETRLLVEVTEDHATEFLSSLEEKKAAGTVNKYRQFFKMFYRVMMQDGKIVMKKNPFDATDAVEDDRDAEETSCRKEFTPDQLAAIFAETKKTDRDLFILMNIGYFVGCRLHDACNLKWEDIDLQNNTLTFLPHKIKNTVKNKAASVVNYSLNDTLLNLLLETPVEDRTGYILPRLQALHAKNASNITHRIKSILERCGLQTTKENKKGRSTVIYSFHSLRYTFVSQHAEKGTPLAVIQSIVGHHTPAMTQHYLRISHEKAREVSNNISLPAFDNIIEAEVIEDAPALPSPEDSLRQQITEKLATMDEKRLLDILQFISADNF